MMEWPVSTTYVETALASSPLAQRHRIVKHELVPSPMFEASTRPSVVVVQLFAGDKR